MLDYHDLNQNGDTLDELPIDSLELPDYSYYKTYKITPTIEYIGEKDAYIHTAEWWIVWGDTVLVRNVEYRWYAEYIADKFGVVTFQGEASMPVGLTGAIIDGKTYGTIVSIDDEPNPPPINFTLENNYPNPFNATTRISYTLPRRTEVRLKVFDILGRLTTQLVNEEQESGWYEIIFNADNLSSGIYFYSLTAESRTITKSMLLLK
jgi:hypothetical protein